MIYTFILENAKTLKKIKRKMSGSSRMVALRYLVEKIRHPENYTVVEATSAL